jgi:lipopolysaccharide transport system ATP-binding protein
MSFAVRAENLGKRYRLGATHDRSLRDLARRAFKSVFGRKEALLPHEEAERAEKLADREVEADGSFWALRDVSFEVKPGQVVGIIGPNGSGKSTLLKILSQITAPTTGRAEIHGRIASLLEIGTGFHPELSGRENVFLNGAILGMTKAEIRRKFDEIVAFADIDQFIDTPVKRYSSGMYVRLAFAVAAHLEPEILIVDEVLAVGDANFQKKCLEKIDDVSARDGKTVIIVSHGMGVISQLCEQVLELRKGNMVFRGDAQEGIRHYMQQVEPPSEAVVDFTDRVKGRFGPQRFATWRSMEFRNAQGRATNTFKMGERMVFRLKLNVHQPSDDFEIGIAICNLLDVGLHWLVSGWEGFSSISRAGEHTFEVALPRVLLFPGDYLVHVWIAIRGEDYDDAVHFAAQFHVEEGRVNEHPTYFGRFSYNTQVYTPSEWTLVD